MQCGNKIRLLSKQLEVLSEEKTLSFNLYLGEDRFLSQKESWEWPYLAPSIYGTVLNSNGDTIKKDISIVNYPNEYVYGSLPNGRFIIIVRKGSNIFARTFTMDGNKDKDSVVIHRSSINSKRNPGFAIRDNKIMFVWSEVKDISPGFSIYGSIFNLSELVDVKRTNENEIPRNHFLHQNYPNPFNPSTAISYQLSEISNVTLKVYDILGRKVATLVNEQQPAGRYEVQFNASQLASGIYFAKMIVTPINGKNPFVQIRKMLLTK